MTLRTYHVVSFSTGLSSALTVERVLNRYHPSNVYVVFMDTLVEDEDNYRFMYDCYRRWRQRYGHEWQFVTLTEGRTPVQVWEDAQLIPNQKYCPCTFELKIQPFTQFILALACGLPLGYFRTWKIKNKPFQYTARALPRVADVTVHIGYDLIDDAHRIAKTQAAYKSYGFTCDFPLTWKPWEFRKYSQVAREDWGIEPPRMYEQGYTHANCGEITCPKAGWGDWLITRREKPESYFERADWERMMQRRLATGHTILRDQSNGTVKPLTLYELDDRFSDTQQMSMFETLVTKNSSACLACGVGDLVQPHTAAAQPGGAA